MAKSRVQLAQLSQQLRQRLREDRTEHLAKLSADCASKPLHEVYGQLKRVGVGTKISKRQVQPLPMFRDAHGDPSITTGQVAECWRKHCEVMEAGSVVSHDYLMAWILGSHHHRMEFNGETHLLPNLCTLERHLRKMRPGKAPGTDCVPPDMCHFFAGPVARMLFPLVLKEALGVQEPVEHKGGQLIFAYKGRGAKDNPASYRGLMLTSVLGKAVRATFRDTFLPSYRKFLSPTYFSARDAGHVGQACMSLQLFCRIARNMNHSAGILFLDIRAAYYCLCRELTCGWSGTDQQVAHILAHFDMPVEYMQQLHEFLATEGGAVEHSEMHPHHQAILSELTSGTWFRVRGSTATTQTHGGSRPGDGLADLVFAYVFGKLISNLKDDLHSIGIWDSSGWTLAFPREELLKCPTSPRDTPSNLDVIWADDLALAFRRPLASDVTTVVKTAAEFLFEWCARYGMRPNTDRGKTEILFQFRGPGSRAERMRLFEADQPTLVIEPASMPPINLHLVAMYKHLGAQLHFGVKLLQEIKIRGGMMRSAYNKFSKKVFKNPNLTLHQRGQLLESMIFSILRWNLGAWYELDDASYSKYRTSILSLARRTCMTPHGAEQVWKWQDDRILAMVNLPDPQESLHLARMSFFATAFHTAPDEFWCLVYAEQSWLRCVHEATFWAFQQLQGSTPFTALHEFQHEWVQGIRCRGPKWKGWIRRAKQHAILQRHNASTVQSWHIAFYDKLVQAGVTLPDLFAELGDDIPSHQHACGPCKQVFASHTAWSVHANRRHGKQDPLRAYITDGICRCCLSNYHTTRQLLAHLHYNERCARNHIALATRGTVLPGRNSRHEDRDRDLPLPVVRPKQKICFLADEDEDYIAIQEALKDKEFEAAVHRCLESASTNSLADHEVAECVRQLLLTTVVAIETAWNMLVAHHNTLEYDSSTATGLRIVFDKWSVEWLFQDYEDDVTWPKAAYKTYSMSQRKWEFFNRDGLPGPRHDKTIPRQICREAFIIHFCSGVRREGDIQWWAERCCWPGGIHVTIVSVDIIFHEKLGDLTSDAIQDRWIAFLTRACVIAAYIGPPCSTWSISRWRFCTCMDDGPRPVRSRLQPFGLTTLRLREVRENILGNKLLFFAFDVMLRQLLQGRVCLIEHPEPRDVSQFPCIWMLKAFRQLCRFPDLQELTVWQGLYGGVSPKPTRLAVCGVPDAQDIFDRHRTTSVMPAPLQMGKSKDNGYSTSQLKEYPSALAHAMADLATSWAWAHSSNVQDHAVELCDRDLVKPFEVNYTDLFARGADTRGAV